ncbi:hypothetical protein G9C85_09065 [Halorubellus sp. JP-L1]|uniref:hypothetical protein n=1 Tax=Halorubellus sp. JP-L1 TaxID=2715753 RepID=UPI001409C166|nr:hypothetical protein [Halorubellus sp. JP-L1]NHN41779.1 hypothetical protein [Halorubellus sp. JP-L1]
MGSSIFADESGDASADERRTASGEHSVFRRPEDGDEDGSGAATTAGSDDAEADGSEEAGGSERSTMTVFSDGTRYEFAVEDVD